MHPEDEKVCIELWALWELYRRLEIPAEEIFLTQALNPSGERKTLAMAVVRGEKHFVATIQILPFDAIERIIAAWPAWFAGVAERSDKELRQWWSTALYPKHILAVAQGLKARGIETDRTRELTTDLARLHGMRPN